MRKTLLESPIRRPFTEKLPPALAQRYSQIGFAGAAYVESGARLGHGVLPSAPLTALSSSGLMSTTAGVDA